MKTYCMSVYGSPLKELDSNCIDRLFVTWRKGIRRLLGQPYNAHCELLNLICDDSPIDNQVDRITCKFLASCKASDNFLTKLCYNLAHDGSHAITFYSSIQKLLLDCKQTIIITQRVHITMHASFYNAIHPQQLN